MAKKPAAEKPYLFVDLSNLVYKNTSSLSFLRTPDGLMTGGVYGTIRSLLSWSAKFRVWVFADGYGTQRRELIKGYKSGRRDSILPTSSEPGQKLRGMTQEFVHVDEVAHWEGHTEDASAHKGDLLEVEVCQEFNPEHQSLKKTAYANMDILRDFLPKFGFPVVYHPEFEADDMIGAAVFLKERKAITHSSLPMVPDIYVMSTDKDFDQLPAHRLSPMKAHLKYATAKSPISGYAMLGATTHANFPEIPEDSILRTYPFALSIYRALVGDTSDKIKGIMTPLRAWKKNDAGEYNVEKYIRVILEALDNPTDFLTYAWNLDTAFKDKALFLKKVSFCGDVPEEVITNLQVIKLPIDLVRTAAEPKVRAWTGGAFIEHPLATYWLGDLLPASFVGWEIDLPEVEQICNLYQMPSIKEKLQDVSVLTPHFL